MDLVIQNKIRLLFKRISEPGYVMDNYYADQLIDKLSGCPKDPEIAFLKSIPLVSDLTIEAYTSIENAHLTVKVFLTRMLALCSTVELHFIKMCAKNGDAILKGFCEINSPNIKPSLQVAYMELALALTQHDSGVLWLLQSGIWKGVLSPSTEKQTVFVVRQTYKFAAKFLWRINDMGDEANVNLVLGHIVKPIVEIDFLKLESLTSEEEEQITKLIDPILQMLLLTVMEDNRIKQPSLVINILLKEYTLVNLLYIIFDRLRKEETVLLVLKLNFWLIHGKIFLSKPGVPGEMFVKQDTMELGVMFFNSLHFLIKRRSATAVLDFCNSCYIILATLWKDLNFQPDGNEEDMAKQALFLSLVPPLRYVTKDRKMSDCEDGLNMLITNMLHSSSEHTARAGYALRDLTGELDCLAVTMYSVKRMTCLKAHLNDDQANLLFTILFYFIQQFAPHDDASPEDISEDTDDYQHRVDVMTYVMDIVLYLVKNYNINWRESLEVICLYNICYNVLKKPNLTCKFIVTTLNVIAVTVSKCLQPNLSLLMELKPGSAIDDLGQLIYRKLNDRNWEVRDSALELLLVCTEISYIKFPSFQKQIREHRLINMAATLAFNDYEFYVQVSALKCIGAATKVSAIWEQLRTEYPDIQERLLLMFRNNQEGIARKEACNVLCDLYQNLKLSQPFKQALYEHLVSSALADFHWEVQLTALKFWKMVIQSQLSDQGMLDGTFPPVTFSRESRKIVTLNETEIQRRLIKILDELSAIGCLTVLIKLLQEDTEVDVMETALNISTDLLNILNKYKVPQILKSSDNDILSVEELQSNICEENDLPTVKEEEAKPEITTPISDNVIEGILNSDDINLLANIYEKQMSVHGDQPQLIRKPKIKLLKSASGYFFVNYLKSKDFRAVVEQKKSWKDGIRSISSLLDDVLGIYETVGDGVNTMDCY